MNPLRSAQIIPTEIRMARIFPGDLPYFESLDGGRTKQDLQWVEYAMSTAQDRRLFGTLRILMRGECG